MSEPSPCDEPPPELLLRGIEQFNRGEFYEQHDTLEALWKEEPRPVRELYQGILQVGVAFYQLERRNYAGVVGMLTRGRKHLEPFEPRCQGVDVAALREAAARALAEVERLGPAELERFDRMLIPTVRRTRHGA